MKIKDMTVRKRIVLSNISMIVIPIIILSLLIPLFFYLIGVTLDGKWGSKQVYHGSDTVSQLQNGLLLDQMVSSLSENNGDLHGKEGEKFLSLSKNVENTGFTVLVRKNGASVYVTQGSAADGIEKAAERIAGETLAQQSRVLHSGSGGVVLKNKLQTKDGSHVDLLLVNAHGEGGSGYQPVDSVEQINNYILSKTGLLILIIVTVFVLTMAAMSFITAGGIVRPLEKLRRGTDEMRKGNLDYKIDYESKNEIGQVCADFDDMRVKLRASLKSQQQLERSRKEMIAGFSHDLNTPLTSIKGYLEGLLDGIAKTPEKQKEYLHTIYSAACDMEKLVGELFLFSKLDADQVSLALEKVKLVDYMADCCDEKRIELEKSEMELKFNNNCVIMALVRIDRGKFTRVILNILSNSVKYKKPGTGHIHITVSNDRYNAYIDVEDDGVGVEKAELSHIFDTFYRVDPARTKVHEGSGLGLSIAKQIIELHGGRIWAEGALGKGLTIHISLPLAPVGEDD